MPQQNMWFTPTLQQQTGLQLPEGGQVTQQFKLPEPRIIQVKSPTTGKVYPLRWDSTDEPDTEYLHNFLQQVDKPDKSAADRFLDPIAETFNPISMLMGGVNAVMSPIETVKNIYGQMENERGKAIGSGANAIYGMFGPQNNQDSRLNAGNMANLSETYGHGLASLIPVFGPMAAGAGQKFQEGDIAGGFGDTASLFGGMYGPNPMGKALGKIGEVTRLNKLPGKMIDLGMGASKSIRSKFGPGIGQEMIDQGTLGVQTGPFGTRAALGDLEGQLMNKARSYDAANPPNIGLGSEVIFPGFDYAVKDQRIMDLLGSERNARLGQLSDMAFEDMKDAARGPIGVEKALKIKRAEQMVGKYGETAKMEPTKAIFSEGKAQSAREAAAQRIPEAKDILRSEQRMMGGDRAITDYYNNPAYARRGFEAATLMGSMMGGHAGKGAAIVAAMEAARNPLFMSLLAHGVNIGGKVVKDPNVLRAIMMSNQANKKDIY